MFDSQETNGCNPHLDFLRCENAPRIFINKAWASDFHRKIDIRDEKCSAKSAKDAPVLRKNANKMSKNEIERFVKAFKTMLNTNWETKQIS